MKSLFKILSIIVVSVFMFGCSEDEMTLEPILIAKGSLYGGGNEGINEQNTVITDQATWTGLMNQMNKGNNVNFTETDIDFSVYQVIAVFYKVENRGYDIELDISTTSENIEVTVTDLIPDENIPWVLTQPYHIVKIPVNSLPVVFK